MTTALQQAAQAMLAAIGKTDFTSRLGRQYKALEAALAAPEQAQAQAVEPVAIYRGAVDCGEHGAFNLELLKMIPRGAKLYTHPAPPATGEPLSEVQIVDWMWGRDLNRLHEYARGQVFLLIRDVEAHHKIGVNS